MSRYGGDARSKYDDDDDDGPRRYHSVRTRARDRDEPEFVREETYIERGKGAGPRDLTFRGREDSIEDIPRDFPPPGRGGGGYDRSRDYDDSAPPPRRARSAGRRQDDYYDDYDKYTDYATPEAAGAAGYAIGRRGNRDRRHRRNDRDYDSEHSESPPPRDRRKSGVGEMLEGLGLAGVAGALLGGNKDKDKGRDRSDSRGARSTRSRSRARTRRGYESDEEATRDRSRGGPDDKRRNERKWAQAAQAALIAGAVEAFRSRNTPGPWTGEKGKRIATAALGAGGIDGLLARDPDKKSKRHLAEAVLGGLAANRLANGPSNSRGRDEDMDPDGRPRSRSRSIIDRFRGRSASRGPRSEYGDRDIGENGGGGGGGGAAGAVKGLVAGGALAAAGKAIYDRVRSKSRKRRSPSNGSEDSYVPSRTRRRDRRRSLPSDTEDTRQNGGAMIRGRDRDMTRDRSINGDGPGLSTIEAGGGQAVAARGGEKGSQGGDGEDPDSSSDTEVEKKRRHMRGKELLTAGLATIATIHAAHGVYSSMEAHEKRHRLVAEGEMTPEEARKKQTKAWVQDAAAVGIAALGIKGAFSEWKEMTEQRKEVHELEKRKRDRAKKRAQREKQEEYDRQERMAKMMGGGGMMNQQLMMQNGMYGMPQMPTPMSPMQGGAQQQPPDQSGNPYAPRN